LSKDTVDTDGSPSEPCQIKASKPSCLATSSEIGIVIKPLALVAIKLITSGVANSPATRREPSFSKSSSSTAITILPALKSAIASSIVLNLMSLIYLRSSLN